MGIIGTKLVPPTEVHIAFSDGELTAKTHLLPHIRTVDHGDKNGLPLDMEYHFALDGRRTLVVHVTEHVYSEMRKTATIQRLRDLVERRSEPKRVMIRERRKPSYPRRGPGRGGSRTITPRMVDISAFTSEAILARMGIKPEEEEEEEQEHGDA